MAAATGRARPDIDRSDAAAVAEAAAGRAGTGAVRRCDAMHDLDRAMVQHRAPDLRHARAH
eukprot:6174785-Pleurochrysis_carterae.AAC.3